MIERQAYRGRGRDLTSELNAYQREGFENTFWFSFWFFKNIIDELFRTLEDIPIFVKLIPTERQKWITARYNIKIRNDEYN